ncbi:class 1 fructose-bisphosphatase [bacterium]|nr:class 1 fructose-bisphosphatase [bacterium]|tara:strand:+ start:231 stop:1202 length:972 start_codon:yes stop_codon:yes gene_type:complete
MSKIAIHSSGKTVEQHLLDMQAKHDDLPEDIANILYDISLASKMIRNHVIVAGFQGDSTSDHVNIHGESVKKLDLFANTCLIDILSAHGRFSYIGSEEEDDIITVSSAQEPSYAIFFDPLDGSSNIDVNVSVGTIFSVYQTDPSTVDINLQPGSKQVAAGYVIYGSSVMLVYTTGHGVFGFTYDPNIGEFLMSHDHIRIPDSPKYYSVNESLYPHFSPGIQAAIDSFKVSQTESLSSRYVGSLVADFHRNLLKGGVFAYPALPTHAQGKLRLMYEANPLAFICEQAGGSASNGSEPILSIKPSNIHDKTPLFIGNTALVNRFR